LCGFTGTVLGPLLAGADERLVVFAAIINILINSCALLPFMQRKNVYQQLTGEFQALTETIFNVFKHVSNPITL
jgi:hypothetical protein